jgi:hypothetical protein
MPIIASVIRYSVIPHLAIREGVALVRVNTGNVELAQN